MIIVTPELINQAKLTATNVPETDAPLWLIGHNYLVGDQVIYNHRIYESLQHPNTGHQPDISPLFWLDLGATNRYRMFDAVVSNATINPFTIDVTITPGVAITGVILFGVNAATARLIGTSAGMGTFYDRTIELDDYSAIAGWFSYFYEPVGERLTSEIAFLDIPAVGAASYQLILDNGSADAECGEAVFGQQMSLGLTSMGAQVGIIDYSRKEVDEFGNFIIVPRRYANKGSFDVLIDTTRNAFIKRRLAELRTTPVVFIGDQTKTETIIYGFYKDFNIVISGPEKSECAINVEGLT